MIYIDGKAVEADLSVDLIDEGIPFVIDGGTFAIEIGNVAGLRFVTSNVKITGWRMRGDSLGGFTVKVKYNSDYTGAPADITGGGISIETGATGSGDLTTTLARGGILQLEVTANGGEHTVVSGLLLTERE